MLQRTPNSPIRLRRLLRLRQWEQVRGQAHDTLPSRPCQLAEGVGHRGFTAEILELLQSLSSAWNALPLPPDARWASQSAASRFSPAQRRPAQLHRLRLLRVLGQMLHQDQAVSSGELGKGYLLSPGPTRTPARPARERACRHASWPSSALPTATTRAPRKPGRRTRAHSLTSLAQDNRLPPHLGTAKPVRAFLYQSHQPQRRALPVPHDLLRGHIEHHSVRRRDSAPKRDDQRPRWSQQRGSRSIV